MVRPLNTLRPPDKVSTSSTKSSFRAPHARPKARGKQAQGPLEADKLDEVVPFDKLRVNFRAPQAVPTKNKQISFGHPERGSTNNLPFKKPNSHFRMPRQGQPICSTKNLPSKKPYSHFRMPRQGQPICSPVRGDLFIFFAIRIYPFE
jgi:hypothetical protein